MNRPNLEKFRLFLKDLPSPEHVIDVNWLLCVTACIGRKAWVGSSVDGFSIFPNLYVVVVGNPAVGKSLPAVQSKKILGSLEYVEKSAAKKCVNLHPQCATYESLVENIEKSLSYDSFTTPNGKVVLAHCSMTILIEEELSSLINEDTRKLTNFLLAAYNCGDFEKSTKTQGSNKIRNMCLNLFGCCTPGWLSPQLETRLVGDGMTSRILFVWADVPRKHPAIFEPTEEQIAVRAELRKYLITLSRNFVGKITLAPEAREWLDYWHFNKETIITNPHPSLIHYFGRRKVHLIKLATAIHASEKSTMVLDVEDFEEAEKLLLFLELSMHKCLVFSPVNKGLNVSNLIITQLTLARDKGEDVTLAQLYNSTSTLVDDFDDIEKAIKFLEVSGKITWAVKTGTSQRVVKLKS